MVAIFSQPAKICSYGNVFSFIYLFPLKFQLFHQSSPNRDQHQLSLKAAFWLFFGGVNDIYVGRK